jgi:hypothetical protein
MRLQFGSRGAVQSRLGLCGYVTPDAHESPSAVQWRSVAKGRGPAIPSKVGTSESGAGVGVAIGRELAVPVTCHESSNGIGGDVGLSSGLGGGAAELTMADAESLWGAAKTNIESDKGEIEKKQ